MRQVSRPQGFVIVSVLLIWRNQQVEEHCDSRLQQFLLHLVAIVVAYIVGSVADQIQEIAGANRLKSGEGGMNGVVEARSRFGNHAGEELGHGLNGLWPGRVERDEPQNVGVKGDYLDGNLRWQAVEQGKRGFAGDVPAESAHAAAVIDEDHEPMAQRIAHAGLNLRGLAAELGDESGSGQTGNNLVVPA